MSSLFRLDTYSVAGPSQAEPREESETSDYGNSRSCVSDYLAMTYGLGPNFPRYSCASRLRRTTVLAVVRSGNQWRDGVAARRKSLGNRLLFTCTSENARYLPLMWNTRSVHLSVRLPTEVASEAEELQRSDPDFLSRMIEYGLTRRAIYRRLRATDEVGANATAAHPR